VLYLPIIGAKEIPQSTVPIFCKLLFALTVILSAQLVMRVLNPSTYIVTTAASASSTIVNVYWVDRQGNRGPPSGPPALVNWIADVPVRPDPTASPWSPWIAGICLEASGSPHTAKRPRSLPFPRCAPPWAREFVPMVSRSATSRSSGRSFFFVDDFQVIGLYDYASVMEYPAFSFTKNNLPVLESIPAGIPLSNSWAIRPVT
jgi:hypothetical protein